jgi:sugar fermentation stimulation protein A
MQFVPSLQVGVLIQRYKRFLSDIRLDDHSVITAHCPNTGPMTGLIHVDAPVAVSVNANKNRKLGYTLEMIWSDDTWVGANTQNPNRLIKALLESGKIDALRDYTTWRSEVKVMDSRIDFYGMKHEEGQEKGLYIEVKNVHLRRDHQALFPDTVTARGTRHLHTLTTLVQQGKRAMMIYVVQRQDCQSFSIASDVDPEYALAFKQAMAAGVEFLAYSCEVSPEGINLGALIPVQEPQ